MEEKENETLISAEKKKRSENSGKYKSDGDANRSLNSWNGSQKSENEIKGVGDPRKIENIQTTALLNSARKLNRVLLM